MDNKFIKALKLGAVMLFAASSVSAARYDRRDRENSQDSSHMRQGHAMQDSQMMGAYSAPARYDVRSAWDFFFSADFLFWQNRVDGLSFGVTTNTRASGTLDTTIPPQNGKVLNPDFGWHPGVRLALGMNFDLDNWDAVTEWTHLVSSSNTSVSIKTSDLNTKVILPTRIFSFTEVAGISCDNANHSFKNVLNVLDFNLGRPFYSGKDLTMRPHVGFRASWMKNRENRDYASLRDSSLNPIGNLFHTAKENSWGLGPRFGVDTSFLLGEGFRFFGNLAASVQYVKHTGRVKETNPSLNILSQELLGKLRNNSASAGIKSNLDSALGFGWGTYFDNSNWHVDLSLAYEFNLWSDRYIGNIFVDDLIPGLNVPTFQDIAYHGGTFKLRFDF